MLKIFLMALRDFIDFRLKNFTPELHGWYCISPNLFAIMAIH